MKISAIVPVLDQEAYLERAVRSLFETGYPDLEVVVADDGSRDGTLDVARRLERELPGVRVLRHEGGRRLGVSASRNLGIRESSGELVCFLDGDDWVLPHRFERAVEILSAEPSVDGVWDVVRLVFEDEDDPWRGRELFGPTEPHPAEAILDVLLGGTVWAVSGIVVRRDLIRRSGLFRTGLTSAEDCNLWFRMASCGTLVPGAPPEPVAAYRRHGANTFRVDLARKVQMVTAMADAARWARRHATRPDAAATIARHLSRYVASGVGLAREQGRPGIAWGMLRAAARHGSARTLVDTPVLRQEVALLRESLGGRGATAGAAPGGSADG